MRCGISVAGNGGMKCTADTLNHHGPGELEIDGDRRASLATIGHRARTKVRAAALLAAVTVWLVQPGQAMAQETRAETIRQEQADKQSTVTPPTLNRAERIIYRLTDFGWITGEPKRCLSGVRFGLPRWRVRRRPGRAEAGWR